MSFNVDHPVDHQCAFTSSKAVDSDVDSLVDRPCAFISSEAVSEGLDGYFSSGVKRHPIALPENPRCRQCRLIRNGEPPVKIFPNKERQRKMYGLRVRCQFVSRERGRCEWRGELRGLESHVHNSDGGRGNSSGTARNTDSEREEVVSEGVPREYADEIDNLKRTASVTPTASAPPLVADAVATSHHK